METHGLTKRFADSTVNDMEISVPGAAPWSRARLVRESTTVAVCVIVAWLVVWTVLGAWRMTSDA